ncbi:MAG TPA: LEA type 2 family protein [Myxococcota bacterium]|nr:LEA type 2 family protein [Myxococcota bacterium]
MKRTFTIITVLVVSFSLTSCELLTNLIEGGDGATWAAPLVDLPDAKAKLVAYPTVQQIGSWACDRYLGTLACGLIPYYRHTPLSQMQFQFSLTFQISNPNQLPVPTTELLVALHLWPNLDLPNSHLAGICTTLCEPGTADCPIPPGGACVDRYDDVSDLNTLLAAGIRGALILIMEAINGQPVGGQWEAWTIPPSETVDLTFTFSIGIEKLAQLIYAMITKEVLVDLLRGGKDGFDIPYAIAGKLWFQVPYLGRVAIGIGPFGDADRPLHWHIGW